MAAAAADVAFKVWYFPFRGRGGVIRAALAEAGLAWEVRAAVPQNPQRTRLTDSAVPRVLAQNKVLGRPEFGALREAAPNCASPFKCVAVASPIQRFQL